MRWLGIPKPQSPTTRPRPTERRAFRNGITSPPRPRGSVAIIAELSLLSDRKKG
jgi:hypothetical protein